MIGIVQIQQDEESGLIEKSARDGLKENPAFDSMKDITRSVIAELESRRFQYRRRAGLDQPAARIERELASLFTSDDLKRDVNFQLVNSGVSEQTTDNIIDMISRGPRDKEQSRQQPSPSGCGVSGSGDTGKDHQRDSSRGSSASQFLQKRDSKPPVLARIFPEDCQHR